MKQRVLYPQYMMKALFIIALLLLLVTPRIVPKVHADSSLPALIDLSQSHEESFYSSLDGEWFYFEEKLLHPNEVYNYIWRDYYETVNIPASFQEQTGKINTFATYAVRVKIPKEYIGRTLAIHVPYQYSAYKIYADRIEIASNGMVGTDQESHSSEMSPQLGYTVPFTDEILLTVQISNFENHRGGFENSIYIGDASVVAQKFNTSIIWILFVVGCIFIMGIFMILFAWFRRQEKSFLLFGSFCLVFAMRTFFADPYFYTLTPLHVPYIWGIRLEYIFTEVSIALVILLVSEWFLSGTTKRIFRSSTLPIAVHIISILFLGPYWLQESFSYIVYMTTIMLLYILYKILSSYKKLSSKDMPNLVGTSFVSIALLNDYLFSRGWIDTMSIALPAVGVFVVIQVFMISKSYAEKVLETEQLNDSLTKLNGTLDEQVIARTNELQLANDKLAQQANIDSLTGIYNRHRFNAYIHEAFLEARQQKTPLSIILIDLDEFKKYNDHYGHIQGDELLKRVVHIMSMQLPVNSLFARYGGEEFIVVLPNTLESEAYAIAEVMRIAVEEAQLVHEKQQCGYTTISLGVATMDENRIYGSEVELVDQADQLLYRSKKEGRNKTMKHSVL